MNYLGSEFKVKSDWFRMVLSLLLPSK